MIRCSLCNATCSDTVAAIAANWIPSYWVGQTECSDPVCPECQEQYLVMVDGEMVLAGTEDDEAHDDRGPTDGATQ